MALSPIGGPDAAASSRGKRRRGPVRLAGAAKAATRQIAEGKFRVAGQKRRNLPFVLFRGKGAGGKYQHAARGQQRRGVFQNLCAQSGAVVHQGHTVLGCGGSLFAEHSLPGAGGVYQHPVKPAGQSGGQGSGVHVGDHRIGNTHALQVLAQNFRPGSHIFVGQQQPLPL